jgi:hypothetical protein
MADQDENKGTVEVTLRFWRNRAPSGEGGHRQSGDYLPPGWVWPAGTVRVPRQKHAPGTAERKVNHPFDWMSAIQDALEEAGVRMVPPKYP